MEMFGKHNIPSSDVDVGDRGYGIVMFAAKPTIPYPPAGGRWNIGFGRLGVVSNSKIYWVESPDSTLQICFQRLRPTFNFNPRHFSVCM